MSGQKNGAKPRREHDDSLRLRLLVEARAERLDDFYVVLLRRVRGERERGRVGRAADVGPDAEDRILGLRNAEPDAGVAPEVGGMALEPGADRRRARLRHTRVNDDPFPCRRCESRPDRAAGQAVQQRRILYYGNGFGGSRLGYAVVY